MDSMSDQEVVGNLADFDVNSGSRTERILFNNRLAILCICLLVTLAMQGSPRCSAWRGGRRAVRRRSTSASPSAPA